VLSPHPAHDTKYLSHANTIALNAQTTNSPAALNSQNNCTSTNLLTNIYVFIQLHNTNITKTHLGGGTYGWGEGVHITDITFLS
jgi:hypothetical protein